MANALGFVEMPNLTDAIEMLDVMLKTSNVRLRAIEKRLGGRLVTLIITGDLGSVREAVNAARLYGKKIAASAVIGNPHPETMKLLEMCAKR